MKKDGEIILKVTIGIYTLYWVHFETLDTFLSFLSILFNPISKLFTEVSSIKLTRLFELLMLPFSSIFFGGDLRIDSSFVLSGLKRSLVFSILFI